MLANVSRKELPVTRNWTEQSGLVASSARSVRETETKITARFRHSHLCGSMPITYPWHELWTDAGDKFPFLPSVGTWLLPLPRKLVSWLVLPNYAAMLFQCSMRFLRRSSKSVV